MNGRKRKPEEKSSSSSTSTTMNHNETSYNTNNTNYTHRLQQQQQQQQPPPPPPSQLVCETILGAARRNDVVQIWDLIEKVGVPPSYANCIGQTALHVSVLWGHIEATSMLLELGANPTAKNSYRESTPLHVAVETEKITDSVLREHLIDGLLEAGAKTGSEDRSGKRPIDYLSTNHPNLQSLREKLHPPKRNVADLLLGDVTGNVMFCKPVGPLL
mmetsp:Transcript_56616/g.61302  ORF Transcript_56616/g.61302 Transcript_56616/m.61302 type:complete len:216 (+) Transcript_56616:166-813(+)